MIKHKKLLKNFNFKTMIQAAINKSPELQDRINRFDNWAQTVKIWKKEFNDDLTWDRDKYYFEFYDGYDKVSDTTECDKKYIGQYLYNKKDWENNEEKYLDLGWKEIREREYLMLFKKYYKRK